MALKSTIDKALLQIADMDRQLYANHALTLALHPSQTEERLFHGSTERRLRNSAVIARVGGAPPTPSCSK